MVANCQPSVKSVLDEQSLLPKADSCLQSFLKKTVRVLTPVELTGNHRETKWNDAQIQ